MGLVLENVGQCGRIQEPRRAVIAGGSDAQHAFIRQPPEPLGISIRGLVGTE
jgi:hypothetical protein